jgi:hypothetical protein
LRQIIIATQNDDNHAIVAASTLNELMSCSVID